MLLEITNMKRMILQSFLDSFSHFPIVFMYELFYLVGEIFKEFW